MSRPVRCSELPGFTDNIGIVNCSGFMNSFYLQTTLASRPFFFTNIIGAVGCSFVTNFLDVMNSTCVANSVEVTKLLCIPKSMDVPNCSGVENSFVS